jgi:MFS transporter, YNFM family, putative membrane transport protein
MTAIDHGSLAQVGAVSHRKAIVFLSIAAFAGALTTRVMDAILPQVAQEFHVPIGSAAIVAALYAFAYGAFQLVFGPVGDRYGKFPVIACACVASIVTNIAVAHSTTLEGLGLARFASGIAAGAIVPLAIAWVGDVVAGDERQVVLARFMSGQILGLLAGQISGGVVGEYLGWRTTFYIIAAIYLAALAGLFIEMRTNAATRASHSSRNSPFRASFAISGHLLKRPEVRYVLALVAAESAVMFGAFTFVGASLRSRFGFDFALMGVFLATYCVGGLIYVAVSRRLILALGSVRLAALGAVIVALCYVAMATTPVAWPYLVIVPILGLGFYMLHNTLQTFATRMAPDARGSAVSIFATCYALSQAIGVSLAGRVVDHWGTFPVFLGSGALMLGIAAIIAATVPEGLLEG